MTSSTDIEFYCPRCGSSKFGSDLNAGKRFCHGGGCQFSWNTEDDYGHFVRVTRERFETAEELERAWREQ